MNINVHGAEKTSRSWSSEIRPSVAQSATRRRYKRSSLSFQQRALKNLLQVRLAVHPVAKQAVVPANNVTYIPRFNACLKYELLGLAKGIFPLYRGKL